MKSNFKNGIQNEKIRNIVCKFIAVVGISAVVASTSANANIITFGDAASNAVLNDAFIGSFSTGGLTFTNHGSYMGVWDASHTPNSNGTNSLLQAGYADGDYLAITRTGGGLFNVDSIDLTISWYDSNPSELVYVNGSPITIIQGMQTFTLGLIGVSEVQITGVPSNTGYWALDNVVTAVPEPETYAMLLVGLGLVGFTMRHRRSKTSSSFS